MKSSYRETRESIASAREGTTTTAGALCTYNIYIYMRIVLLRAILCAAAVGRVRGANSYAYDSTASSSTGAAAASSYASYAGEANEDPSLEALVVNTAGCTQWCNLGKDKAMCNYEPCETCHHDPESVCYEEAVEDTGETLNEPGCAAWCKREICSHPECTE